MGIHCEVVPYEVENYQSIGTQPIFQIGEDFMSQSSGCKVYDNYFSMLAPYEIKSINQLEMQFFFGLERLQAV